MRIVIMGCGRVGAEIANTMHHDHDVTIIDLVPRSFERLSSDFTGHTLVGPGNDPDILVQAGIQEADAFVALANEDNANIMGSEIARELFHVRRVITRIYDYAREDMYRELGLDIVSQVTVGAHLLEELIMS